MESLLMSAEHLEGADECTVEALLSCFQDCTGSSENPMEHLEDEYARSTSSSRSCATVKTVLKPVEKPKAASNCSVRSPVVPSSGVAIVSPPKLVNKLQEIVTNSNISQCTIHALLQSPLISSVQRGATDGCFTGSGHTNAADKSNTDLTSGGHVSVRSFRKQILHPKVDEGSENSGLTNAEGKNTVDPTSGGGCMSKPLLQKQGFCTNSAASSPEASATPKPKKPRMPCMRPQKCNVCQKVVCNNEALKTHMRTHTGEKPYSCPMCPERFATSNNLNVHKRTHTGEKPYSCKVCERKFSQYTNMRRHMLTHTGERPHACNFCEKRFAQRLTLRRHLRLHMGE